METRAVDWTRLIAGTVILGIGLILVLNTGGILEGVSFFEFWPLIVIGVGITRVADASDGERRRGGLTVVFIGCWLLIASLGLFGLDYGDSWPLVFIAIGLAVLLTARAGRDWGKAAFFLLLGSWFLVTINGYFGLTMEETWPFAIVAVGLWIALTAFAERRERGCCDNEPCRCGEEQ